MADVNRTMTYDETVKLSNEWMRRYIETPDDFAREFQTVTAFLKDEAEGREPSYGERCAAYIFNLQDEMSAKAIAG